MFAGKRKSQWAGVSALALVACGLAVPAQAACSGTADAVQDNNLGTLETRVNAVAVTCAAGAPDTNLFATSFPGFTTGSYVLFDYDGSGADTLVIGGGTIVNTVSPAPPNPTPVISGIPFDGSAPSTERSLDADNAAVRLLAGDDRVTMTAGTITGNLAGGGGGDTFDITGGTITGNLLGDGEAAQIDGGDTITLGGTAAVQGSVFAGGGIDRVEINDTASVGVGAGTTDSVGLGVGSDFFTMSGGTTTGGVSGNDGVDTFTLFGGTIGTYLAGGAGDDVFDISGTFRVNQQLTAEAGIDRVTMNGGTVGTFVDLGADNDEFTMLAGTVQQYVTGGDGNDTITVRGGTVGPGPLGLSGLFGGIGNDTISVEGGTINGDLVGEAGDDTLSVTGGAVTGSLLGGTGTNRFVVGGGTVGGGLTGDVGVDTFEISGGTINGPLQPGDGNDVITISGTAVVNSFMFSGGGNDTVTISGGTMNGFIDLDDGDDQLTMTGGTLNNHIEGNGGNDTINISGGFVRDFVYGNDGDDTINISGTAFINGDVQGNAGNDRVTVSGGTIRGNIDAESVTLTGGTIGGNISGLSANTLVVNSGSALNLRDGVIFSGVNAVGNLIASDLAQSQGGGVFKTVVFQGFQQVNSSGSQFGFGPGNQQIANLLVADGSTLFSRGAVNVLAPGGGFGNLTVSNAAIDFINGATGDRLNVATLTLNNALIRIDADQQQNAADQINNAGPLIANGANVIFINLIGTPNLAGLNIIPISPQAGETVDPAAAASPQFAVQGVANNAGALFAFDVIQGSNGGLYLRSRGADFATPLAVRVAIDSRPVETVTLAIYDITNDAILHALGLVVGAGRSDGAPSFGVYASGQFAFVKHDGFQISNAAFSGTGPSFTSQDFSLAASVELDAAAYLGLDKTIGLDVGLFGGYASSNVTLDPTLFFADVGQADNKSGMIGGYSLYRVGTTYGLASVTGFFGNTEVANGVFNSTGSYDTTGLAVTGSLGHVIPLDDNLRFDLRGGLLGAFFNGDAYTDSTGVDFGRSELSFGAVKFEPGVYGQYNLSDGTVFSPYLRLEVQQRFGYSNKGSIGGIDFEFDDSDLSASISGGFNLKITETTTLSSEIRTKVSDDSQTFAGKVGLKARF